MDHIQMCQDILNVLIEEITKDPSTMEEVTNEKSVENDNDKSDEKNTKKENDAQDESIEEFDPIASAVASIMGPDGNFDIRKSPIKPISSTTAGTT